MNSAYDMILKITAQDNASATLRDTARAAGEVDKSFKGIDGSGLDKANSSAERLQGTLSNLTAIGAGATIAGGIGLAMSESFINAGLEADRLGAKMATLLTGAGLSGSIDKVKALSEQLAALRGGDDDEFAATISQAVATGRTRSLIDMGIQIDELGQKNIEAAGKISVAAKQQATLNEVLRAGAGAVETLKATTSETSQTLGKFTVDVGNMQENIGMGAAKAKAALVGGILSPLMGIGEQKKGMQESAGAVLFYGSSALTAAGTVATFAGSIGQAYLALQAKRAASIADTIATGANTVAGDINVATMGAETVAAGRASIAYTALARAKMFAMSPVGILGAGLAVGGIGAEAIRRVRVAAGDETAPGSFGEMLSNTMARITGDENGITDLNGKTGQQQQEEANANYLQDKQKKAQDDMQRAMANISQGVSIPSFALPVIGADANIGAAGAALANVSASTHSNPGPAFVADMISSVISGGGVARQIQNAPSRTREISVPMTNRVKQEADGSFTIYLKADPIHVPRSPLELAMGGM